MTSLKFLGNGSAFNYDLDNTSAYFKYDNTFYIFDCGEKIASKIVKYIDFSKENDVVKLDMSVEDGIKYVISCGIVTPTELKNRIKK